MSSISTEFVVCINVLLFFCSDFCCFSQAATSNETDRLALLAFRAYITYDPYKVLSSWNESNHFCLWDGVTCSRRHQRVVMLDLGHKKLAGSLSPSLGNLSFLTRLYLHNNSFTHVIPSEIGHLWRLIYLRLNNNSISGELPANISKCSNLIRFQVSYNKLVGNIPMELGSLPKLQVLDVSFNNLTGDISPLGNLSSLLTLNVAYNLFGGSVPIEIGKLSNLEYLALAVNRFSGTLPPTIFNLSSLTNFTILMNQIQGSLPANMGSTLPNLQFFAISDNPFTGGIPASMSNMSKLTYIQATENNLTGKLPDFGKLNALRWLILSTNFLGGAEANDLDFISTLNTSDLQILALDNNNFKGVMPDSFQNLSNNLVGLWLGNNYMSGNVLNGIGNFFSLTRIQISNNHFTGSIPHNIGKLQNLQVLQLSGNSFSGEIPSSTGNLSLLSMLYLYDNNFYGNIPSSLGSCPSMFAIDVSRNNLSGITPHEIFGLYSMIYLGLSQNNLVGPIPMQVGQLKNLEELYVDDNFFSGELPSTLSSCLALTSLSMQGNLFHGSIPSTWSSLTGISSLDLSRNNLSGQVPEFLGSFKLDYLNLSFNNFEGVLPTQGVFKNVSAVSVTGNPNLCGGVPELNLQKCKRRKNTFATKLTISIVCGLLGLSILLSFVLFYWFKRTKREPSSLPTLNPLMEVSYSSLLEATNGFSSTNLIGSGAFGSVYKGLIGQDRKIVAVKVLNLMHHGASKSFIAECEVLRNIKHRNLVKVLSACSSVDYQGNEFKALVYDYMANGSLEEWLHPNLKEDHVDVALDTSNRKLNFLQRLNISIDVASALDYLHHQCPTTIVHCDLKPSNVLLDDELVGHVGDFGLAKIIFTGTDLASTSTVRGTIGYAAPEYGMGSDVSTYGDVYSFGILMLEMFTGKRPTDDMFKDGLNLRDFVEAALPDRVANIVDPILFQIEEGMEEDTTRKPTENKNLMKDPKVQDCFISILRVGIACSADFPRDRMSIDDATAKLNSIKDGLQGTGHEERD